MIQLITCNYASARYPGESLQVEHPCSPKQRILIKECMHPRLKNKPHRVTQHSSPKARTQGNRITIQLDEKSSSHTWIQHQQHSSSPQPPVPHFPAAKEAEQKLGLISSSLWSSVVFQRASKVLYRGHQAERDELSRVWRRRGLSREDCFYGGASTPTRSTKEQAVRGLSPRAICKWKTESQPVCKL